MSEHIDNTEQSSNEPERVKILLEAAELITGQRQQDYGTPEENFQRIADLWNIQIAKKLKEPLSPRDVAILMIQLKLARVINTPNEDSFKDIAGYTGIGWELASKEGEAK